MSTSEIPETIDIQIDIHTERNLHLRTVHCGERYDTQQEVERVGELSLCFLIVGAHFNRNTPEYGSPRVSTISQAALEFLSRLYVVIRRSMVGQRHLSPFAADESNILSVPVPRQIEPYTTREAQAQRRSKFKKSVAEIGRYEILRTKQNGLPVRFTAEIRTALLGGHCAGDFVAGGGLPLLALLAIRTPTARLAGTTGQRTGGPRRLRRWRPGSRYCQCEFWCVWQGYCSHMQ